MAADVSWGAWCLQMLHGRGHQPLLHWATAHPKVSQREWAGKAQCGDWTPGRRPGEDGLTAGGARPGGRSLWLRQNRKRQWRVCAYVCVHLTCLGWSFIWRFFWTLSVFWLSSILSRRIRTVLLKHRCVFSHPGAHENEASDPAGLGGA